jgi:hypothetical protein
MPHVILCQLLVPAADLQNGHRNQVIDNYKKRKINGKKYQVLEANA